MAELAHVNRFSTAGELTASIAHEINQPLGSILTNAETAKEILKSQSPDVAKLPDIVELKDIVNDILHDDQRATEVIRRMRSLLKKAPFEQKQFDLNEVVQETVRFFSSLAVGRQFELVSVITPETLPILGDRIQLQQVILNLVVNGIDAMKDTPSENRIISIRTSRVENFAQLSVSDRGSGIPEDKLNEVFEPFFTSKAEGMGMGLSIARTIIEAHKGVISAKNRDHGGASFRIKLPLCTDGTGSQGISTRFDPISLGAFLSRHGVSCCADSAFIIIPIPLGCNDGLSEKMTFPRSGIFRTKKSAADTLPCRPIAGRPHLSREVRS